MLFPYSNGEVEKLKQENEGLKVELEKIKAEHAAKVVLDESKNFKEKMHKCRNEVEDDCAAFFMSISAMEKHFIKYHKPNFCIPCNKDFVFKGRLARHKGWREHGMNQPNYQGANYIDERITTECDYCQIECLKKNIAKHKKNCKQRPSDHQTPPPGRPWKRSKIQMNSEY